MRTSIAARTAAGAIVAMSLPLLGTSTATAADPGTADGAGTAPTPRITVAPTPPVPTAAATPTPTPTPSVEPTPSATPEPAATPIVEPGSGGVIDLNDGGTSTPLVPPLASIPLPFNLGSINLGPKTAPTVDKPQFGGGAAGLYVDASVGNDFRVKAGQVGAVSMKPDGTPTKSSAANVLVPMSYLPVLIALPLFGLHADVASATASGDFFTGGLPYAQAVANVEDVSGEVYAANITADGIESRAFVRRQANGEYQFIGSTKFAELSIYGAVNWDSKPIEPNRTHVIPGLGKVVLNEQKITDRPGDRHGIRVNAIHITLSTATLGLPVGTDIYVGSAEAIIHE